MNNSGYLDTVKLTKRRGEEKSPRSRPRPFSLKHTRATDSRPTLNRPGTPSANFSFYLFSFVTRRLFLQQLLPVILLFLPFFSIHVLLVGVCRAREIKIARIDCQLPVFSSQNACAFFPPWDFARALHLRDKMYLCELRSENSVFERVLRHGDRRWPHFHTISTDYCCWELITSVCHFSSSHCEMRYQPLVRLVPGSSSWGLGSFVKLSNQPVC